jgi:hypothetical protein
MVIRGAKIIGRESKNGRTYSEAALDSLVGFYENQSVNVDHDRSKPNPERKMLDGFGVLRNVRKRADGVYGDLHYLKEHALAGVILERAERMPESFGLSHSAEGRVVRKGGKLIVEDVAAVHSVDIVREPATTKGLFESKGEYDMAIMKISEIVETTPDKTPGLSFLREQMDAGVIAADTDAEVAAETGPEDQVKAAFRAEVMGAFSDESTDLEAIIARINGILTSGKEEKAEAKAESAEEAKESFDRTALIAKLTATNMLLESGREATPERVKAVAAADEGDRTALVESWPTGTPTSPKPPTSPPKHQEDGSVVFSQDPKLFAAQLR